MSRIIAIGNPYDLIPTTPLNISGLESVPEMDLKLALQSAELEHGLAERIAGIGSPRANAVEREVKRYRQASKVLKTNWSPRRKRAALMGIAAEIDREHRASIGFLKFIKKAANKVKESVQKAGRAIRSSNLIKKVAQGVVKVHKAAIKATVAVAKGAVKVAKAGVKLAVKTALLPMQLFTKGLIEVFLPKLSRFFLYLFVTNPATIASLPEKVQRKRRKAEKFAKFIINVVGMKEDHFMKIVRNGIVKQTKQTPEQLLSTHVKGSLSGIGIAPLIALIPTIIQLIGKIASLFKKKPSAEETPTAEDAPDEATDFEDAPTPVKRQVLTHLKNKPASQRGYQPAPPAAEQYEQAQEQDALEQLQAEPEGTPLEAPLPEGGDVMEPAYSPEAGYDPYSTDLPTTEQEEQPQF